MKIEERKPFSSEMEYEHFEEYWCERCVHYKLRENDGFPEFPENGGCRILDAMERARIDIKAFPRKEIIEERDENGNVKYWHKCTRFMRNKRTRYE